MKPSEFEISISVQNDDEKTAENSAVMVREVSGEPLISPHDAKRRQSLGELLFFQSEGDTKTLCPISVEFRR